MVFQEQLLKGISEVVMTPKVGGSRWALQSSGPS